MLETSLDKDRAPGPIQHAVKCIVQQEINYKWHKCVSVIIQILRVSLRKSELQT